MLPTIQDTSNNFVGNGVSTVFTTNFAVFRAQDIAVYVDNVLTETGFTVSDLNVISGATITFSVAPIDLAKIKIRLVAEPTGDTDFQENGDFLAETLNREFDRIWQALQLASPPISSRIKEIGDAEYTVVAEDFELPLRFTSDSAIALTVNDDVALAGFNFVIVQAGLGKVTWGGTASFRNYDDHTQTAGQDAVVGFLCDTTGSFVVSGRTS